jgi:hypothetical protein
MNIIELRYILAEHNITLRNIDQELKTINITFPDGRLGKIRANSIIDLSVTDLLKQIDLLTQQKYVSTKKVFINLTPKKAKIKIKKTLPAPCRYYINCTVKCHKGKTGHMR